MLSRLLQPTSAPVAPGFQPTSIRRLFPSPLVFAEMPDDDAQRTLAAKLARRILAHERTEPGVVHNNEGGWQSDIDFLSWAGEEGEALAAAATRLVDGLTARFDGELLRRVPIDWKVVAWANVSRRGAANEAHHHAGWFWSAVYYVDDGGCAGGPELGGEIEFFDPRGPAPAMYNPLVATTTPDGEAAGASVKITPASGSFIVFPSYLTHAVNPYLGDGTRISIAMNFALDEERGRPVAGLT